MYLACNYYVTNAKSEIFKGWGEDRQFLAEQVKEFVRENKTKLICNREVNKVHFLAPTGQGYMENEGWKNRECHAEMQLLKFARDNFRNGELF